MPARIINILISSFPGLGLPLTLSLPIAGTTSLATLIQLILERLPPLQHRVILTTNSNKEIVPSNDLISSLLCDAWSLILPLRLSVPLCGGKGGFGSQLRAAGGRMSSKRKKSQGDSSSSNRNLDGRRLRTVNEAKALAEYLALKPEMDRKGKEARRKRWEQIVELAEHREEALQNDTNGKVNGKWVEDKEDAVERARDAVSNAMSFGEYHDNLVGHPDCSSKLGSVRQAGESAKSTMGENSKKDLTEVSAKAAGKTLKCFADFEEECEFMSESEEGEAFCLNETRSVSSDE